MKFLRWWLSIATYLAIRIVPFVVAGCALLKSFSVSAWADRSWMIVTAYPAVGAASVAAQLGLAGAILLWSVDRDCRPLTDA